jgi:aminodeoxyfutalosine synthase
MHKHLLNALNIPDELKSIGVNTLSGHRISPEEAILLYEKAPLGFLGMLAEHVCTGINGKNVFYIRNTHIEPTNICVHHCKFCSYSARLTGNAWELTIAEMKQKVAELTPDILELHITGGVHPARDLNYYAELVSEIKSIRPDIHLKAFSAIEIDYLIKKAGISFEEGLAILKENGLDAIPGGGAEIFDEDIRLQICPDKTTSSDYLLLHETAHKMGITSNATILYGHIETYAHRVDHMNRLREVQDRTNGFQAFIPLKFKRENNEFSHLIELPLTEDLRNFAVSRIFLDNFPHIKGYWPALGKQAAQLSLSFGVDDMDGTINDSTKIYSLAGAEDQNPGMTGTEMEELIRAAGKIPVERNGNYQKI